MKKGLLLAGLAVSAMLFTGCGGEGKTLNCTMSESAGGATTTSTMDIKFNGKGNKIDTATMNITIDYDESYESYASVFKQTLETQKTNLEKVGYDVKITSGDHSVTLIAEGTGETLDESESVGSYEITKQSFVNSGYTCK